ncbi:hypothetical protein QEN19_000062 [Hanseniaspora menglaensis]
MNHQENLTGSDESYVENILNEINSSKNQVSDEEKNYIKSYQTKELKGRKHLKKQAYNTVLAVLFFKYFTFYESTFFLILRILLTYATFTFSEPARKAVEEAVLRSGSIERLVNDINTSLRENNIALNLSTEYEENNNDSNDHELDDLDSVDFTASSNQQPRNNGTQTTNSANLGDAGLPGGFILSEETTETADNNTGTVTFTSNFGGINFKVETNADFGGVHDNINNRHDRAEIRAITPSMIKKLTAASEDFLMRQFNKKFKIILYVDFLMIIFRILFPLNYDDFKVRRGYAFIDIFSDYKKYPSFFNNNVVCLNLYNLFFELIILGLHITLYQVACLENPKINKLRKKMILLQYRCKKLLKKEDKESFIANDKHLLKTTKPFSLVVVNALSTIKRE